MSHSPHPLSELNTTVGVLQSVAIITGQRDRDLMARTLVGTLTELIHCSNVRMYRILPADQGEEAVLVAEARNDFDVTTAISGPRISVSSRPDFSAVSSSGKEYVQPLSEKVFLSVYPIIGKHGVIGLCEIVSEALSDEERHLVMAFLRVYSNYLTILDESETDTLTDLLNRRTFDNSIEKIIAEHSASDESRAGSDAQRPARRRGALDLPHWLAIIDIDRFKRINDKFGHLYGDEVLLLLSRNMQRIFRQRDKLFRFGGEEFIVVLDRTSEENARAVLDRFRAEVGQYHFPQVGNVTISIGFVRMDKVDAPSAIIGRADQALYYAKHHGRNQVCFYEDLIAKGVLTGERYSNDLQIF